MRVTRHPIPHETRSIAYLRANPATGTERFADMVLQDPRAHARMLDVGCGDGPCDFPPIQRILAAPQSMDGLEPSDELFDNTVIQSRYHATMEEADLPPDTYDCLFAWTVLEHIQDPKRFMQQTLHTLKPGGVFYAGTPHAHHPFAAISLAIQTLGLKSAFAQRSDAKINDYPAHYRLNSLSAMRRACKDLPVASIDAWHVPTVVWGRLFPKPLRFAPSLYDRLIQSRFSKLSQFIMFRVEKTPAPAT